MAQKKRRIILQFVEGLSQGGIEAFVTNVYKNLDKSRFDCEFLVLKTSEASGLNYVYENELIELGAKIYYLIKSKKTQKICYLPILMKWLFQNRGKYDVVHIHASHLANFMPYIILFKVFGFNNIILHSHNSTHSSHRIVMTHKICRKMLPILDVTKLACGTEAGKWMYGEDGIFSIIPNGIDTSAFQFSKKNREESRKSLKIEENCIVLGHIGAFRYQKNHEFLIELFQKFYNEQSNARLVLVGEGERLEEIVEIVKNRKLTDAVLFLGNRKDVNILLSAFDIFLFPSHYEGLSIAAIEAQVNGVPLLMSENIAQETIMTDKVWQLPINRNEECYKNWLNMIYEALQCERNSLLPSSLFEEYSITNTVGLLERIYENDK